MKSPSKGKRYLKELAQFLRFLQSLWGILTGISVLFPLSNTFVKVIPLNQTKYLGGGGLWNISPLLVTTVTTMSALFVILYTFERRDTFNQPKTRPLIRRQAGLSFAFGLLALMVYLIVYALIVHRVIPFGEEYVLIGGPGKDPRWLATDTALLLCYATFFTLMTRAFELLAMIEYFRGDSQQPTGQYPSTS
jgi:hypothetical protein